jgi:hypothetical protein
MRPFVVRSAIVLLVVLLVGPALAGRAVAAPEGT